MKHLLKMLDLSTEEIIEILDLADQLEYELEARHSPPASERQVAGHDLPEGIYPYPCFF